MKGASPMAGVMHCCSVCPAAKQPLRYPRVLLWSVPGSCTFEGWIQIPSRSAIHTHLHALQRFWRFVWRHPLCFLFFPLISVWHWKLFVKSWRDCCSCFPSLEWVSLRDASVFCQEGWIVVLKYFCCGMHQFNSNCCALSPLLAPS